MSEYAHDYAQTVATMKKEVAELERRRAALKKGIRALEALMEASPGIAGIQRTARSSGPASTANCPDDMKGTSVTNRILDAMAVDPSRRWTATGLHEATFLRRRTDVVTNLHRLKERGRVIEHPDLSWGPVVPGEAVTE